MEIELQSNYSAPSNAAYGSTTALEAPPEDSRDVYESQLPPVDGGKDAWLFLAGCFMVEALVWGFAFSFGVFQDYYSTHEPFAESGNVAVIGTCAMGTMYISCPLVFAILLKFPRIKRWSAPVGLVILCLALALSSFSQNTTHLILSQGVGYAVGGSLTYSPAILFMEEWFSKRIGLAFGVMWAGTGLSGVILPVVMQWLLNTYGYATTLRIWSIVVFALTAPLLYFVKPRLPIAQSSRVRPFDMSFLWSGIFNAYQLGNIVEALGFFLPTVYLPTYARTLGASNLTASLTVVLCNVASVFGCVAMGSMGDRYHAQTCILVSTVGSTLGVFLIWGFAASLAPLYLFCVVYGLFAGSFTSTWPAVMRDVQTTRAASEKTMIFGFLAAGRGIGNVVSGPLSEALVKGFPWRDTAGWAYGSGYGTLIVFTGVTALLGGIPSVSRLYFKG